MPFLFLGALIAAGFFGGVCSLLALIPPVRALGRRSLAGAVLVLYLLGLSAGGLGFTMFHRGLAEINYIFIQVLNTNPQVSDDLGAMPRPWRRQWLSDRPAIVGELWQRLLRPPGWRLAPCYSGQTAACQAIAEYVAHNPGNIHIVGAADWPTYLMAVGFSLLTALINCLLVYRLIRPAAPKTPPAPAA